jgi:hypothetical protein
MVFSSNSPDPTGISFSTLCPLSRERAFKTAVERPERAVDQVVCDPDNDPNMLSPQRSTTGTPVILDADYYDLWLDPGMRDFTAASDLLKPCDARPMRCDPVNPDQQRASTTRHSSAIAWLVATQIRDHPPISDARWASARSSVYRPVWHTTARTTSAIQTIVVPR